MSPKPFPRLIFFISLSSQAFPFVGVAMLKSPRRGSNPYTRSNISVLSTTKPFFKASMLPRGNETIV